MKICEDCEFRVNSECHLNPPVPLLEPMMDGYGATQYHLVSHWSPVDPSAPGCSHHSEGTGT